jgi:hypothetical protein
LQGELRPKMIVDIQIRVIEEVKEEGKWEIIKSLNLTK